MITNQVKVATTGTAVQLAAMAVSAGISMTANPGNSGPLTVGGPGVTNTANGSGNGVPLWPGQSRSFPVANASELWVNGAAGDWAGYTGS